MTQSPSCKQLWTVAKQLLLLSHGQATVERGFSVNKEREVENMAESTFAAKRMVCDHVQSVGGIKNIDVTNKQLQLYYSSARQKYSAYLEDQKKNRSKVAAGQKRKALCDEVSELKVKKKTLQNDADALATAADDFSKQAEKSQQLTLLAKANGMRRAAREKADKLKEVNQLLDNKLLELENCP